MICLDTNVVIDVLRQKPARVLERVAHELPRGTLALSSIVLFELQYGIAHSVRREENSERLAIFLQAPIDVLLFDAEDAEAAGALRAELKRAENSIGPYDVLIAAQARRRRAVLVTSNSGEFSRVPGLTIEDWAAG